MAKHGGDVYVSRGPAIRDSQGEEYFEPRIKCLDKVRGFTYIMAIEDPDSWTCTQREWENMVNYYPRGFTVDIFDDLNKPRRVFVNPVSP